MTTVKITPANALERVLSTFVQVYLSVVLASATGRVSWADAFWIALFAAATAALTTLLIAATAYRALRNPYADLGYRTAVTFGQTLVGLLVAAGAVSALTFDWQSALKVSLIAAGTALLKGLIGLRAGETNGAAVLDVQPERGRETPAQIE